MGREGAIRNRRNCTLCRKLLLQFQTELIPSEVLCAHSVCDGDVGGGASADDAALFRHCK